MARRVIAAAGLLALFSAGAEAQNLPPNGQTFFFAGQTSPDLSDFRNQVLNQDSGFKEPAGISLYTNIAANQCNGTTGQCNLGGSGNVMNFPQTLQQYPGAALHVGLFLSDTPGCENQPLRALAGRNDSDLANGVGQGYRNRLDDLLRFLRDTGRNVYLRIGYEFDGPWNCYNREFHIQAFRYAAGRINALGANNIDTVWHSATFPLDGNPQFDQDFSNPNHFNDWYPGDQYVDWVGISTFYFQDFKRHAWSCLQESIAPVTLFNRALQFARNRGKPVFISESAPQGYQTDARTASCILRNAQTGVSNDDIWNQWYADYFQYISDNRDVIRAFSYINSDWERIGQFNCAVGSDAGQAGCTDGYWGDSRYQGMSNTNRNRFKNAINQSFIRGLGSSNGGGGGGSGGGDTGGGSGGSGSQWGFIKNTRRSGLCMTTGGSTSDNAQITQDTCTSSESQDFDFEPYNGGFRIINKRSNKCLRVQNGSTSNNALIVQYTCRNWGSQTFDVRGSGVNREIVNRRSGLCMRVESGSTNRGARIVQSSCSNNRTSDNWEIETSLN